MGKRTYRQKRKATVERSRVEWSDREYGISLESVRLGKGERVRLRWLLDGDPFVTLLGLGALRRLLDQIESESVAQCREDGASWEELGWALDRTGEAVRRRHVASTVVGVRP